MPALVAVKFSALLKANIDTLLKERGQTRKDLAQWCRRSESWISKIFRNQKRDLPARYIDRIADFFGLMPYQLLQPNISPLAERRHGNRRRMPDRRRANLSHLEQINALVGQYTVHPLGLGLPKRKGSDSVRTPQHREAVGGVQSPGRAVSSDELLVLRDQLHLLAAALEATLGALAGSADTSADRSDPGPLPDAASGGPLSR